MFKGIFAGKVTINLIVALKWEDREIKSVELDFSKINGKLINDCNKATFDNFNGNAMVSILPAQCPEYCARMAAAISDIPFRALEKMNAFDYETITAVIGSFINKRNPQKFYTEYVKIRDEADEEEKGDPLSQPEGKSSKNT